jgi:2-methylisocitrate lyase-like PEP mutase family enzyme
MTRAQSLQRFRALHQEDLLILPNAWDVASARVIEYAGAAAIATSSAALAWAHGYPDGEVIPADELLSSLRAIVRAVGIPVSADIEAGYGADAASAAAFASRVAAAGVVGINLEDGTLSPDLLAAKIEAIKRATPAAAGDLWINARTDVYLRHIGEGAAAYDETVKRARRYRDAGADSIFIPAVVDEALIANLVRDIALPLNLLAFPGLPQADVLRRLGVRRLSAGGGVARAALNHVHALAKTFLAQGSAAIFAGGEITSPQLNDMMRH